MSVFFDQYGEWLTRMLVASLLGGLIGVERDFHGRAAGLRTHLLVALGAAVFMILSEVVATKTDGSGFSSDPARIAAQIVTGIGFLGAGVIIKEGANVRGLTTAACLWIAAAIGMSAGSGNYVIAGVATGFGLSGLILLKLVERLYSKDSYRILTICTPIEVNTSQIIEIVKRKHLMILNCNIQKDYEKARSVTRLSIRLFHRGFTDKLAHGIIRSLEESSLSLNEVRWDHS